VIVSVSRRTDIPRYFAGWFMQQVRAGVVHVPHPFRSQYEKIVSLRREDASALVFWTRDPRPLFPYLAELERGGFPYYFLITMNGYPPPWEPDVPDLKEMLPAWKELARRIGRRRLVWRYDPVLFTPSLGMKFHMANFNRLAASFAPFAFRVIVSLLDVYPKVKKRLQRAGLEAIELLERPTELAELLSPLAATAKASGLEIQSCAEPRDLTPFGVPPGKCIDEKLLNDLFGLNLSYQKDRRQRSHCLCQHSADIGVYGTCRAGCLYCYAR